MLIANYRCSEIKAEIIESAKESLNELLAECRKGVNMNLGK